MKNLRKHKTPREKELQILKVSANTHRKIYNQAKDQGSKNNVGKLAE
jgi:hypothetical protein